MVLGKEQRCKKIGRNFNQKIWLYIVELDPKEEKLPAPFYG
jgi:hypothetical protein